MLQDEARYSKKKQDEARYSKLRPDEAKILQQEARNSKMR